MPNSSPFEHLKPVIRQRIMDLVADVGHDISDWGSFKGDIAKAASNPKYCYEWVYSQENLPVILNLWFSDLQIDEHGTIYQDINMRAISTQLSAIKGKKPMSTRAFKFDEGLKYAGRNKLPLRIVICDGDKSVVTNAETPSSKVEFRKLDPEPWSIASYDMLTGQCRIERKSSPHFVDQHTLHQGEQIAQTDSSSYIRQRHIRDAALERAEGKCEYCNAPGFLTTGNYLYLETHHVVPLSEGGDDTLDNVISLCPNDHKLAHFGINTDTMRLKLQEILSIKQ